MIKHDMALLTFVKGYDKFRQDMLHRETFNKTRMVIKLENR